MDVVDTYYLCYQLIIHIMHGQTTYLTSLPADPYRLKCRGRKRSGGYEGPGSQKSMPLCNKWYSSATKINSLVQQVYKSATKINSLLQQVYKSATKINFLVQQVYKSATKNNFLVQQVYKSATKINNLVQQV
uniref:Uncharacterized protein n=1 Tax=Cacopsylla melanoneura TaxID=428564 RepID=A0A8D8WXJ7_9HEMI